MDETVRLLQTTGGPSWRFTSYGFLDVIGDADPIGPRFMHRLVHRRLLSRIYERVWRPLTGRLLFGSEMAKGKEVHAVLEMLDIEAGDRVLDVGCGPGNYTRRLAQEAGDGLTVGIDASKAMLEEAVERGGGGNLAYVRGDARTLPFESEAFDVVCCVGVIHMIDDAMGALDEMVRVLAPGGCLVVGASCGDVDSRAVLPGGVRVFGHDELTGAFAARGLVGVGQRVSHRGQFVSGHKVRG
jgi:SAM-dependent methyltransferase